LSPTESDEFVQQLVHLAVAAALPVEPLEDLASAVGLLPSRRDCAALLALHALFVLSTNVGDRTRAEFISMARTYSQAAWDVAREFEAAAPRVDNSTSAAPPAVAD